MVTSTSRRHRLENRKAQREERLRKDRHFQGIAELNEDELDAFIEEACLNPWNYARMILGATIFEKQQEIMEAMIRYPKLAVAGCNSSGKTFTCTPQCLWNMTVLDRISVMEIAPTESQSRSVFWRDMRGLYRASAIAQELLGNAEMHRLKIEVDEYKYAMAVSPGDEMNLRGFHADVTQFILDEGNGIEANFFDAIEGIGGSGELQMVQLGNPTKNSGVFFDAFDNLDLGWKTMHISAFDSPNLQSLEVPEWFDEQSEAPGEISDDDRKKIAFLAHLRREWIKKRDRTPDEQIPEYQILTDDVTIHLTRRMFVADGEARWAKKNDPSWYGRVLGVFPSETEHQLFSRTALAKAGGIEAYEDGGGPIAWGVDPAGLGKDEFALTGVQVHPVTMRHRLVLQDAFQGETAFDLCVERMKPYVESGRSCWINIDSIGVGARPAIELKRWAEQFGVQVFSFVSNQQSTNPVYFKDLKAQAYCYLRDLVEVGVIAGLGDNLLRRQMLSIQYEITPRGQLQMESKVNMKKRGVDSPNRADALCYACFNFFNIAPWSVALGT